MPAIILTILLFSLPAQAESVEEIIAFADYLFVHGEYLSARVEYQRGLFICDSLERQDLQEQCRLGLVRCLYNQGDYRLTIEAVEAIIRNNSVSDTLRAELNRLGGLAGLRLGYYRTARLFFQRDSLNAHQLLLALASLPLQDWHTAQTALDRVHKAADDSVLAVVSDLDTVCRQFQGLALKSPAIAAMLSAALPGAGHAYAGYYQTGLASLVLNAALIGSSLELIHNGQEITGGTVSVIAFGWYIGNIVGSYTAALKTNRARQAAVLSEFERKREWLFR